VLHLTELHRTRFFLLLLIFLTCRLVGKVLHFAGIFIFFAGLFGPEEIIPDTLPLSVY